MSGRPIAPDSVDQSTVLRALDSTTFLPYTTFAYNTAGIDMWYRREGAAKVSITEATLAALTTAHADGGIIHIGDGYFRMDLPDAAVAAGVDGVAVGGTATGVVIIGTYHPLNFITAAGVQSECNDALVAYDPPTNTEMVNAFTEIKGATWSSTTDTLEKIRDKETDIEADTAEIGTAGVGLTALATAANQTAIKAKTDSLTFTKAGEVDANIQSVNGVTVNGDGSGTPMGV